MDMIKVEVEIDKSIYEALIEKVVHEEIEKLAHDKSPIGANELIKLSSSPLLNVIESTESIVTETTTFIAEQQTELSATTESFSIDSETVLPTTEPALEVETIKIETIADDTTETLQNLIKDPEEVATTENSLQLHENVTDENGISDSLLSAVGDLLSSILGLDSMKEEKTDEIAAGMDGSMAEKQTVNVDNESVDKTVVFKETIAPALALEPSTTTISIESESSSEISEIEQGTEKTGETATPVGYEGDRNNEEESEETSETVTLKISTLVSNESHDKVINEIDLKIENLANAQTSFATENTLEQVTETVRVESTESEQEVLEVISEPSIDGEKPVSFQDSVNQVMNLVKSTEGRLSLGESILIDKNMKEDLTALDQIVYGTLKEVESNLGMHQEELTSSYEPVVKQSDAVMENFQGQNKNSLNIKHPYEFDNFMVKSVKAAMEFKHQLVDHF